MIEEGKKPPAFTLPDQENNPVSLKDFTGTFVVLYFYPKDNTPGCTQESCDFRDNFARITSLGAVVLGISADSVASHGKFKAKFDLPFPLLSDEARKVIDLYDVWREKNMYGKKVMGIQRSTFIIGPDGRLVKQFRGVKVKGHVDEVLEILKKAG